MAISQRSSTNARAQATVSSLPSAAAPSKDKIAARAYQIWEEQGRPDGRHEAHWYQAERELKSRMSR